MSSIYKGTTEFTKVYLGANEISKIYNGSTLIFQNVPPVPPTPQYYNSVWITDDIINNIGSTYNKPVITNIIIENV